jgi:hypothetical protein
LDEIGATAAAGRVIRATEMISDDIHTYSIEDLERVIDPELVIDERADVCGRLWPKKESSDTRGVFSRLWGLRSSTRLAHWARNTAALLPLIFTWSALGWATWEYELDLHNAKGEIGKPFLLLWQQGFTDHFLPFGWVAALDALFLLGVVALTGWVHRVERSADEFATSLWSTVGGLEKAIGSGSIRNPVTAQDWAREVDRIIRQAYDDNRKLTANSEKILSDASGQFASAQAETRNLIQTVLAGSEKLIQDQKALIQGLQEGNQGFLADFQTKTQETISLFSTEVLKTLDNVRKQNEIFIESTRKINEQVLNDLVQRQIRPLLTQTEDLLGQFRAQQESYATAVTRLNESVTAIEGSAAQMADSSQESIGSIRSIAGSLQEMASSQGRFSDQVRESARSMTTAATSITEVKDALQAVLVDSAEEMVGNITKASASLARTQASVAETQAGLAATTAALRDAATDFRRTTTRSAPPTTGASGATPVHGTQPIDAINELSLASTVRRRWWQRFRRSGHRPDQFGGQ